MRNSALCAAFAALVLSSGPALAHHAFSADFDVEKPVSLNGTITRVDWTNPHVYTWMDVKDDKGKVTNWKVEMGSPKALTKAGWNRNKLKVGQTVMLQGWRAKDGTNFANAEEMTTADGKKLSAASSYDRNQPIATSGSESKQPVGTSGKTTKPNY